MPSTVEPLHARTRPEGQLAQLFADGWPSFITADQVVKQYISQVRPLFADLELALIDLDDVVVATGWAVPIRWDGDPASLPGLYRLPCAGLAQLALPGDPRQDAGVAGGRPN